MVLQLNVDDLTVSSLYMQQRELHMASVEEFGPNWSVESSKISMASLKEKMTIIMHLIEKKLKFEKLG